MAVNLVDLVKSYFPGDAASRAGVLLGENESNVRNALGGIIPSVLAGLANRAEGGANGLGSLINSAKELIGGVNLNDVLSGGANATDNSSFVSKGITLLQSIFGDKLDQLIRLVSGFAGIKESSANTLLGVSAPAALGAVGQYAGTANLDEGGIRQFLREQKNNILAALPAGLSLGSLGLGSLAGHSEPLPRVVAEDINPMATPPEYVEERKSGGGWLMWLLLLALAGLAIWYFMGKGCNKTEDAAVPPPDTVVTESTTETVTTTTRASTKVILPDGTELDAYRGGIEDQLVTFLKTDYKRLGEDSLKNTWFNFDNLNFETNSATITAESQLQVNNMVAILKAFPEASIKIGGYTDRVGDEAVNVKLSTERAQAVAAALKNAGVGKQVTGAEGYGSQYAQYPAEAPESDRVTDRKVAVSVR